VPAGIYTCVTNAKADLTDRARAGDGEAFRQLIEPYQRELELHCYRILGSVQDAEDALQETLLAAWRGLGRFEGQASVRTWLYQIATNCCLKALRSARRRPQTSRSLGEAVLPEPTRPAEVTWVEPCPDALIEGLADSTPGPEARYEAAESVSLAFITALQLLSPRQRAVLILRDVLGFHAREAAQILDSTEDSVTSALKRARATLRDRLPRPEEPSEPPTPGSAAEQELIAKFTRAYRDRDLDALIALLARDVRLDMPPIPLEYHGRELAAQFLKATAFRARRAYRLIPTRANGQPAFGTYLQDPHTSIAHATGLIVLTLAGPQICAMTSFDNSVLPRFGLPRTLPD
jgi:RNA polymerase sigma-70 factor (TIGR02960 family)